MVTVKLRPWVIIGNINHIKTRWQIASDASFNNVLDDIESNDYLDAYYSPINTVIGVRYYARAMRYFDNNTDSGWLPYISFLAKKEDNGVYLSTDIKIDTPMVYVNKKEVIGDNPTITISTSKFRGVGDGHYSTHWIVENGIGEVIYTKLNDTVNKTSIVIDKSDFDLELNRYNNIVFKAVHNSGLDVESSIGEVTINNTNFNFEVRNKMLNIEPYSSYTFDIIKNSPELNTNIVRMEVKSVDSDDTLYTYDVSKDELSLTVPSSALIPNTMLYIDLYVIDNGTSKLSRKRIILKTLPTRQVETLNSDFTYENKLVRLNDINKKMTDGIVVEEIYDNTIPFPNNDKLFRFVYNKKTNTFIVGDEYTGISMLNSDLENSYIKYSVYNNIIVDTLDGNGHPIFMLYKYDEYNRVATLIKSKVRNDETIPIGKTNAFIYKDDKAYYIPPDSNKLKVWDIINNTISDLVTINLPNFTNGVIIDMYNGEFIILGGSSKLSYTYKVSDNTLSPRNALPPEFRGRPIKSQRLVNGDVLIYKTTRLVTDVGNNMLLYKHKEHKFETLVFNLNVDINPTSSILFRDGSIIFYTVVGDVCNVFKYT